MKILLTALCLVFTLGLVGCGGSSGPGDAVVELNYAMEEGDVETVKKIVPALGSMMGDEKLKAMMTEASAEAKKKGGIESVEIIKEEIEGETATVTHKTTFGNGDEEEETTELVKVDGQWIISMDDMDKGGSGGIDMSGEDVDFPSDFEVPEEIEELPVPGE
jgi:hypothetical protein